MHRHPEERSDEGSAVGRGVHNSRSFASLRMTAIYPGTTTKYQLTTLVVLRIVKHPDVERAVGDREGTDGGGARLR
jgi:hypothetical protein